MTDKGDLLLEYCSPSAGKAFVGCEAKTWESESLCGADGEEKSSPQGGGGKPGGRDWQQLCGKGPGSRARLTLNRL